MASQARRAMEEGRYDEAAGLYEKLVEIDASNSGLVMNLGLALEAAGKPREAVAQFERARKMDPSQAAASIAAGQCWRKLGEPARALEAFQRALKLEPHSRHLRLEVADAYYALQDYQRAVEFYEQYTSVDQHEARAWKQLGLSYARLGQARAAELGRLAPQSKLWRDLVADSDLYREAQAKPAPAPKSPAPAEPDCSLPSHECEFLAGHYRQLIASLTPPKTAEALYWQARCYEELAFLAFSQLSGLLPPEEIRALLAEAGAGGVR